MQRLHAAKETLPRYYLQPHLLASSPVLTVTQNGVVNVGCVALASLI